MLPSGTRIEFTAWQSKATEKWHTGEPSDITRAKRIQVQYQTDRGRTGYFTLNAPFPGKGSTEARLNRITELLQGNVDYYTRRAG